MYTCNSDSRLCLVQGKPGEPGTARRLLLDSVAQDEAPKEEAKDGKKQQQRNFRESPGLRHMALAACSTDRRFLKGRKKKQQHSITQNTPLLWLICSQVVSRTHQECRNQILSNPDSPQRGITCSETKKAELGGVYSFLGL